MKRPAPDRATPSRGTPARGARKRATRLPARTARKSSTAAPAGAARKGPAASPAPARRAGAGQARRPSEKGPDLAPSTREIVARLEALYPGARCSLDFEDPLQLLVATILSAQCTDERVNQVTPELFRRFPDAHALAEADLETLEDVVRSTGFFHNKARSLLACSREILLRHGGEVPRDLDSLVALPGIGRKTANVVLGNAFGIPGIVVDTHVSRLSQRLRLTSQEDPNKIELDLMQVVPRDKWIEFAHLLIEHGRRVCKARTPLCVQCVLSDLCPSSSV